MSHVMVDDDNLSEITLMKDEGWKDMSKAITCAI